MKIKLERRLISCPDSIKCGVCQQIFPVSRLRTLLYSDRGFLIGDICPDCFNRETLEVQRLLRQQGNRLMAYPQGKGAQTIASHQQALELLEISTEAIEFPTLFQRWLKHLEIFTQESQELEAARFRLADRTSKRRSQLEKMFEQDLE